MIDKMSIGASRLTVGRVSAGREIGSGHFDGIKPPNGTEKAGKADKTGGSVSSLAAAIDYMVQQGMPVDMQRIAAIRQAIADGQYPVDRAAIADAILDFDRSVGGL